MAQWINKSIVFFFALAMCCTMQAQQTFWNQFNISLDAYIYGMTVTPAGKIFVGSSNGVYVSADSGMTWMQRRSGLPPQHSVGTISSDSSGNVYAGVNAGITPQGIYLLPHDDTVWIEKNSGLIHKNITAVAVHPTKGIVFAGTYNSGSFLMKQNDTAWSPMDTSLSDPHIGCFLVDTVNDAVFAGTWSGVFRSTNDGMNWERVGSTTTFIITTMAVNSKGYLFAGSSNYGIFRSTDNGGSWVPKNTEMFDSLVANLIVNPHDVVYTSTSMGVFYSTNDGDSWENIFGIAARVSFLTLDVRQYLYAGTQNGTVYRSKASTTTAVVPEEHAMPIGFELFQNYPNPFNPSTTIKYRLSVSGFVTLKVFDLLGREVAILVNDEMRAGEHSVPWYGSDVPSGIYLYRLQAGEYSETRKLVLLR